MSELPIKATLKAGKDYDAPWITVDGADPADLAFKLNGLAEAGALQAVVDAANLLKAANVVSSSGATGAAPAPAAPAQAPAQAQPQGWGAGQPQAAPQQQAEVPSWAAAGAQKICPCGQTAVYKSGTSKAGKPYALWACPQQKRKDDGHLAEFVN